MELYPDFKELLVLFNVHHVEYMIVGGYALALHGTPRATGDLDIFVKPDLINARHILDALADFGFGSLGLSVEDFLKPDTVIQLGVAPIRIDIMTSLTAVSWEDAVSGWRTGRYGDVPVHYIGREQFIKNRKSLGRKRDLADLEALGEA